MKLKLLLAGALAAGMGLAGAPSHAAVIVATPGNAQTPTFGLPVVPLPAGTAATYVNLDPLAPHPIESVDTDNVKRAWCSTTQANQGKCPLFALTDQLPAGSTGEVLGTADLEAGAYVFKCTLHPLMTATLQVV